MGSMELLGVCVGKGKKFPNKTGWTGIEKHDVPGAVRVSALGLVGDEVMDQKHHGGPDQAVYIYTQPDYEFWRGELGDRIRPGLFGENLLFSGLESASVKVGQRFRVGSVVLEAASSRIPCETFAAHMGDPKFVKKFREVRRPGIYARVVQEGELRVGDAVTLEGGVPADAPTILDTFEFFYARPQERTLAQVKHLLSAPVAVRLKTNLQQELQRLS